MIATAEIKQVDTNVLYGPRLYQIDKKTLDEFKTLKSYKPVLSAVGAWLWIFLLVKTFLLFPNLKLLYPIFAFLIAGRAGVFLQLVHEAAHGLVSKGKFNDWFGNWMAAYPIGLDLKGYQEGHTRHHVCTNQKCDPVSDSEKYRVCDVKNPKLWLLFLKDLLGITAISVRFMYEQPSANLKHRDIVESLEYEETNAQAQLLPDGSWQRTIKKYASISLIQLLILGFLFNFNVIHYFFLWLIPLVTAHMVLMRVRGIAEHGLGIQLGVKNLEEKTKGSFYTRSFGTPVNHYSFPLFVWLERFLIGSLDVYYHHEHHLYPTVPYYNLHKIHKLISEKIKTSNPDVYAKGYFACLFFNLNRAIKSSQIRQ